MSKKERTKLNTIALKISLLPWETFYKDPFTLKARLENNQLIFEIMKNNASYSYFLENLFYKEEKACFFKNIFNYFQQLTINNPKYPYVCSSILIRKEILKELEKIGIISIIQETNNFYFNKLRSFKEQDLPFLELILEKYQIKIATFKIGKDNKKLIFYLKTKEAIKEMWQIKAKLKTRKKQMDYIKKTFKDFIFPPEETQNFTLKLEKKIERI